MNNSAAPIGLHQSSAEQAGCWRTDQIGVPHFMEVVNTSKPARIKGGELSASQDEPPAKVRKPYTITKQRERWTEEEHQKFIEALRLYGRAWRRIEEHIGTKSAVQIRSHAQKFFSKLEREALGGLSAGIAQDIEIPPPRPKRKPSHPYPRKAGSTFSGSPSAFEEGSKSPPAVYSAFTPLRSLLKSTVQDALIKNGTYSSCSNQSMPSMLGKNELQRRLDGSSHMSGSSTSLKLFGQTLVFPVAERAESIMADTLQANAANLSVEPAMVIPAAQSQSKAFEKLQLLSQVESIEKPSSCKNEAESWEKFVAMARSQDKLGVGTSTDSSKNGILNALLGETSDVAQSTSSHCQRVSSKLTVGAVEGEGCPTDRHKGHRLGNQSSLIKGTNAAVTMLASVSSSRLPCFPVEPSAIRYIRCVQGPSSNVDTQRADSGSLESLSSNPSHPLQTEVRQNLPTTAATAGWPDLIPGNSFHNQSKQDTGAAAVAAFTLAAASAWWALQGVVSSACLPPLKRARVYNPVAVIATEKPSFLSSTSGLKTETSVKKQHFNAVRMCKAIREHLKQEQKTSKGNEKKDEPTASIKHQVSADTCHQSSQECYSSSEIAGGEWYVESSSCQAEVEPAKKCIKSSSSLKVEGRNEGSGGSSSGSNALLSNNDCEKQEDENNLYCCPKTYGDMQEIAVCNLGRPAIGPFREENAYCRVQQLCRSEDNASHSKDLHSAGRNIRIGDSVEISQTVDENKGCTVSGINEFLIVDAGKTNPEKHERQASRTFEWKQRKQDLLLSQSKPNEYQYPCSMSIEHDTSSEMFGRTCPKFMSLGSRENVSSKAEDEDCTEGSLQAEEQEQGQKSVPVKTEVFNGCSRYSGAGFVPYQKLLEDGKTKLTTNFEGENRNENQGRNT